MPKKILFSALFLVLALSACAGSGGNDRELNINNIAMKLTSPDFSNGGFLPADLTCDGQGRAPILEISEVPTAAASLALIADDPDAPLKTWTHWLIWNLSPETGEIAAGNLPDGAIVGKNSGNRNDYGPACPPGGVHRYYFKLYALDTTLNLEPDAKAADLIATMKNHILDQAELMGKYERK